MARVVICPSCQSKGAVPDHAQAERIRCPKCGVIFNVGAEAGPAGSAPAPPRAGSRFPRSPAAAGSGRSQRPILLYALLGVSGLAALLLGAVLVVLLSRGDGQAGGGGGRPETAIAEAAPAPHSVTPTAVESTSKPGATGIAPTSLTELSGATAAAAAPVPAVAATTPTPAAAAIPSPPDPQEVIRRLKNAAVYIKNKVGARTISSGSGFVIEVDGNTVTVATNRHVAVPDLSELPPGLVPPGARPTIEAVFRSGQGKEEQDLAARIIAADSSDDLSTDLAFLEVRGVNHPPAPIDPMVRFQSSEGMVYIGAGFPLGGMLSKIAESPSNPSVTITGGRIAALRRDAYGQLAILQVDGSLQPGNSGGPIIEEKTGKLIGVAVAKVGSVDTIGFVVPADEVRRALAGRVGSLDLTLEPSPQGTAHLLVKALLVDPKGQVGGVVVRAAPASAVGTVSPSSDGIWQPLPHTQAVELRRDARMQLASGHVQVALSGQGANFRKILIQAAHRDLRGRLVYSKPHEVLLPDQPGPIRPAGDLARIIKAFRNKSMTLLGPLVDPSKDCRLDKDDRNFKLRIDIPGKLHTLSPELTRRSRSQPLHNSPMTLTEVDGDFVALVEVTGDIKPGSVPPHDRAVRGLSFTVQSAGLILYQDKNNFLRLERAGSILTAQRLRPVHRLIIEAVKDGKQAMDPIYMDVPEGDTLLIMERKKGRVRCLFSPNGGRRIAAFRQFALSMPAKVQVGLSASNISAQPFTATFENFVLLNDVTKMDQALGD